MNTYICWYEPNSDMILQVARIAFGDKCNNVSVWGLLDRYEVLKSRFGIDKDGFMSINDKKFGRILAMLIDADNESDAIITFANKMGEVNDRTKGMPT